MLLKRGYSCPVESSLIEICSMIWFNVRLDAVQTTERGNGKFHEWLWIEGPSLQSTTSLCIIDTKHSRVHMWIFNPLSALEWCLFGWAKTTHSRICLQTISVGVYYIHKQITFTRDIRFHVEWKYLEDMVLSILWRWGWDCGKSHLWSGKIKQEESCAYNSYW